MQKWHVVFGILLVIILVMFRQGIFDLIVFLISTVPLFVWIVLGICICIYVYYRMFYDSRKSVIKRTNERRKAKAKDKYSFSGIQQKLRKKKGKIDDLRAKRKKRK